MDPDEALVRSSAGMVLASFLFGLVLVLAATVYVCVRGVRLWRVAKATGGQFTA